MAAKYILFVHGTGVRQPSSSKTFRDITLKASAHKIPQELRECTWGDSLGSRFARLSLPGPASLDGIKEDERDFAQWAYLFDDPMFELRTLTIPSKAGLMLSGLSTEPKSTTVWRKILNYEPSHELRNILDRELLNDYWDEAKEATINDPDTEKAFLVSGDQTAEPTNALARSIVARLTLRAEQAGESGPGPEARSALVSRLLEDWNHQIFAISGLFARLIAKPSTYLLREYRHKWSRTISHSVGDILLYQASGHKLREFILAKIGDLEGEVILMGHSLGGVACVDVLVQKRPANVVGLITFGSQASFLYEMGALYSLKSNESLPDHFPRWLNLYDRNDFLSFLAMPVFPGACNIKDEEIRSGRSFPASHCSYLGSEAAWKHIKEFVRL